MEKRKYSVIVFDLGMVILPFDYNIALERLEKTEKGFGVNYLNHFKSNYETHRQFERGDISEDEFLNRTIHIFNGKIDKETFYKIYSEIFTLNKNVADLLPELKKKYRLMLLSNTNPIHYRYWINYGFVKNFEKLFLSHEVRSVKPEEKIYKAVESYTKLPPEVHIFIDDISEYVQAAKNRGWDAIQFTGYENLVEELKTRLII